MRVVLPDGPIMLTIWSTDAGGTCTERRCRTRRKAWSDGRERGKVLEVRESAGRVRSTSIPRSDAASQPNDFTCAYAVDIPIDDERSSEQWARAAWEHAPVPLQWLMVTGWRFVLGLQLGPPDSSDHILGWRIVDRGPHRIVCQARSRFLNAYNVFQRIDETFLWSTEVTYDRLIGRVIWLPVSPVHRLLARTALRRAATPYVLLGRPCTGTACEQMDLSPGRDVGVDPHRDGSQVRVRQDSPNGDAAKPIDDAVS
jgi:uncharacterized protein DUF2867